MKNNRKKILIACDSSKTLLGFRGKLIESLTESNEVLVYTPQINDVGTRDTLLGLGVKIYENNLDGSNVSILSDLKYISSLYRLIKTEKPDVFFPYTFKPVIYGSLVARICRVGTIVPLLTGLGYNFVNDSRRNRLVAKITRMLLRISLNANKNIRLILQNRDDYHTLLDAGIIGKNQRAFVVNGSGVDLSYYEYTEPVNRQQRFLMIARLINAKGVREYYEAASLVREYYPDVTFRLIGPRDRNIDAIDDELYNNIVSQNVIEYLGEVKDVRPYIRDSSVVVLPSYYGEGIPRCLLEALAMGRAVITCDSVGCRETVNLSEERRTGFLVPAKNAKVLAEKMSHFITCPDDVIRFGMNGRLYADEKFDVHKVNHQMLHILQADAIAVS